MIEKHQKLLILSIIFIFSTASFFLNITAEFILFSLLIISFFYFKKVVSLKFSITMIIILAITPFYTNYRLPKPDYLYKMSPCSIKLTGIVNSINFTTNKNRHKIELQTITACFNNKSCNKLSTKVLILTKDTKNNIKAGNVIKVTGLLDKPNSSTNPSQFSYADYLKTKSIFTILNADKIETISNTYNLKWLIIQKINQLRDKILEVHSKFLPKKQLEILGGIVFGANAIAIDKNIKQDFINSGLLHLLAASGMNVSFIFAATFFLLDALKLRKNLTLTISGIAVAVYSIMTGLPPSIMRAAGMLELAVIGKLLERDIDNNILLTLIAALMILFNPIYICDIGFQLSFLATFGLLFMISDIVKLLKTIPVWISGIIFIPIIAQLWVLPIQIYHFNSIAVYSIFANIIIVPISEILSYLGFTSSLIAVIPYIGTKICFLTDKINLFLIDILLLIANKTAHLSNALIYTPSISIWLIIAYYFILICFGFLLKEKMKLKTFFIILFLFFGSILFTCFSAKTAQELKITFFDIELGDSTLIQTPYKKNILIDNGNYSKTGFSSVSTIILPFLRDKGINTLDLIVLTHPDLKHIGGTKTLLDNIKVLKILDNSEQLKTDKSNELKEYLKKINNKIIHIDKNPYVYRDRDLEITFIKPQIYKSKSSDEKSIIYYLKYKKINGLFLSDNKQKTLNYIKNKLNYKYLTIIKAGSHGDTKSLDKEFLEKAKPKAVIISAGKNKFFYPQWDLLKLLKSQKIKTYRADKDFCIQLISDGVGFNVVKYRDLPGK